MGFRDLLGFSWPQDSWLFRGEQPSSGLLPVVSLASAAEGEGHRPVDLTFPLQAKGNPRVLGNPARDSSVDTRDANRVSIIDHIYLGLDAD